MRELLAGLGVFKDAEPVDAIKRSIAQLPEGDALTADAVLSSQPADRRSAAHGTP